MEDLLSAMYGQTVVVDTDAPYSYVGRLSGSDDRHLELDELVIYDERIVQVSLEEFLIECQKNGLVASRGKTLVNRNRIVTISLFDQVVVP